MCRLGCYDVVSTSIQHRSNVMCRSGVHSSNKISLYARSPAYRMSFSWYLNALKIKLLSHLLSSFLYYFILTIVNRQLARLKCRHRIFTKWRRIILLKDNAVIGDSVYVWRRNLRVAMETDIIPTLSLKKRITCYVV